MKNNKHQNTKNLLMKKLFSILEHKHVVYKNIEMAKKIRNRKKKSNTIQSMKAYLLQITQEPRAHQ